MRKMNLRKPRVTVPVAIPQQTEAPTYWSNPVVVINHDQSTQVGLFPGTPIKIELTSGVTRHRIYAGSTPTTLSYWEKDTPPKKRDVLWKWVTRVTVISLFDLVAIGRLFETPVASPSNGKLL